jgi:ABC-type enterochelin transport system substrate-binding protein
MIARIMLSAACAVALFAASASAQDKPVRVRGTIEAVDGSVMTIKARDGAMLKVKMPDNVNVVALIKATMADIKSGSYVGSTALPEQDGSWKAVEVHIFPEAMRGTGEGDRPYDHSPKSTMTNGTVDASVAKVSGSTMTLKYKEGEKKIDVTPDTAIVMYTPGSKDELKAGAKIYIPAATKQEDGSLLAARINVGRGVAPPM